MAKSPPALTIEGLKQDLKNAAALLSAIADATGGEQPCADELLALSSSDTALLLLHAALIKDR